MRGKVSEGASGKLTPGAYRAGSSHSGGAGAPGLLLMYLPPLDPLSASDSHPRYTLSSTVKGISVIRSGHHVIRTGGNDRLAVPTHSHELQLILLFQFLLLYSRDLQLRNQIQRQQPYTDYLPSSHKCTRSINPFIYLQWFCFFD